MLGRIWRIDWALMRQLIVIGAPISISFLLEYGLFAAAALLMGLISTTALAAHQIALQVTAILFMVPFGISMAATVRVGHAVGRNDAPAVRRAGFVAMLLGIVFMSVMTLAVILGRYAIARFFFGEAADSAGAVIELTAGLLLVGATFFVADGIQTVVAGALRGLNDTRVPLLFAAISYWLIGFSAACGLGFQTRLEAIGVWIGLSCGTAVYAVLLILRFRRRAINVATAALVEESHESSRSNLTSTPARCWPARSSSMPSASRSTTPRSMRGRPPSECWRGGRDGSSCCFDCAIVWLLRSA